MQNQLSTGQCAAAAPDAFDFDFVRGLAQSGGINENDRNTAHVGGFFDGVAGRPWNVGDNGAIAAQELIEQAGFADVGPSDDGGANAPAQNPAFIGSTQQGIDESDASLQSIHQFFACVRRDVLIREINVRFEVGQNFHQIVPQEIDAFGKFAGQLLIGGGQGQF